MITTERLLLRYLTIQDVPRLLEVWRRNRAFLQPWSPQSDDSQFTESALRNKIEQQIQEREQGRSYGFGIFTRAEEQIIGRINVSQVVRGTFQNCFVGYWLDEQHNGQGFMKEALAAVVAFIFEELKLHRIEATTLVYNVASQRVLAHVGFRPEGVALHYLQIDGRWQDHYRFALTAEDQYGTNAGR